jgi:hypothetical protein
MDIRGPVNPTAPFKERWPARFYTQRELQKAVRDQTIRRQILFRLIPTESAGLISRTEQIHQLDTQLHGVATELELLRTQYAEAAQAFAAVVSSKTALERFAAAGADRLISAQADQGRIDAALVQFDNTEHKLDDFTDTADLISIPQLSNDTLIPLLAGDERKKPFARLLRRYKAAIRYTNSVGQKIRARLLEAQTAAATVVREIRAQVEAAVIASGGTAEELNQFDALTRSASGFEVQRAAVTRTRNAYRQKLRTFGRGLKERAKLVSTQRAAMERVRNVIAEKFPDRIRIESQHGAETETLERWILNFREVGITRWWNTQKNEQSRRLTPEMISTVLKIGALAGIGERPSGPHVRKLDDASAPM